MPLRDLFGFAVWVGGVFGHHVQWRDRRLRLRADGRIYQDRTARSQACSGDCEETQVM